MGCGILAQVSHVERDGVLKKKEEKKKRKNLNLNFLFKVQ
jgi:hypothetical protein